MREREQRQQQMFMPLIQSQPQSENSRFIVWSFVFLLFTVALIAAFLIILPLLQQANF
jgi:hypothetical protein